jgi:hypothetical protein
MMVRRHLDRPAFTAAIEAAMSVQGGQLQLQSLAGCAAVIELIKAFIRHRKLSEGSERKYRAWALRQCQQYFTPFFGTQAPFELKASTERGFGVFSRRQQRISVQTLLDWKLYAYVETMTDEQMALSVFRDTHCLIDVGKGNRGVAYGPIAMLNSAAGQQAVTNTLRFKTSSKSSESNQQQKKEQYAQKAADRPEFVCIALPDEHLNRSTRSRPQGVLDADAAESMRLAAGLKRKRDNHIKAQQGAISSVSSFSRLPDRLDYTLTGAKQHAHMQKGEELTISYNARIP